MSVVTVVLGIGIAGSLRYASQQDYFFADIEELVTSETGYILEKSGPAKFILFPRPTLSFNQVVVVNPAQPQNPRLGETGQLKFILKLLPLLRGQLVVDLETRFLDANLHIYGDEDNNWMTDELRTISTGLPFDVDKVLASNTNIALSDHRSSDEIEFQLQRIDINLEGESSFAEIESAGLLAGTAFKIDGELQYSHDDELLNADLRLAAGKYSGDVENQGIPISEQILDNFVRLPIAGRVSGSLDFKNGLPRGTLTVEADAEKLDNVMEYFPVGDHAVYDTGPLEGKAELRLNGLDMDVEDIQVRMQQEKLNFYVEGSAHNVLSDTDYSISVSASAKSLADIPDYGFLASLNLQPDLDLFGATVDMVISGNLEEFSVEDMRIKISSESTTMVVSGDLQQLPADPLANLSLDLTSTQSIDLEELLPELEGLRLPAPVDVTGIVRVDKNSVHIEDIQAQLGGSTKLVMSGNLLQLPADPLANLSLDLTSTQSIDLEELLPELEGLRLPAPVDVTGIVRVDKNSVHIEDIQAQLGGSTKLVVSGNLLQLQEDPLASLDLHLISDSAVELEEFHSDLEGLRLNGPFDIAGALSIDNNHLLLEDIRAEIGESDLQGSIQAKFAADPPRFSIDLQSRNYLTSIFKFDPGSSTEDTLPDDTPNQPTSELEPALTEEEIGERFEAYTSSIKPNTDWLQSLHLNLDLIAQSGKLGNYEFDDLNAEIEISNGILDIRRIASSSNKGSLQLEGDINTSTKPPTYHYSVELDELELELFFDLDEDLITGGNLSGELSVTTEGETLSDLLGNMAGDSLITMGPVEIKSKLLDQVSTDVLSTILGGIINKEDDRQVSAYDCGVFGAEIENGVVKAKRTVAMQASDYVLVGKGSLDLNTGQMNFVVLPKARKGIGLSISSIAGGFRVEGNIATPQYHLHTGGIFSNALLGMALTPTVTTLAGPLAAEPVTATIVATGVVVKGFFNRITASNYKCENILKRIERLRSKTDMDDHSRTRRDF